MPNVLDVALFVIFILFVRCGHCQRLKPTWEELAQKLNNAERDVKVTVARVDCTVDTSLCSEHIQRKLIC